MADSKHDDLADALARMAESEAAPEAPPAPPPKPVARPAAKPAVKPAAKAVRPASARPAAPGAAAAPAPKTAPAKAPTPAAAPTRPTRPAAPAVVGASAPVSRPVVPVVRKARPTAPTVAAPVQPVAPPAAVEIDQPAESDANTIIDDDDAMNMPTPDASVFMHRPPKNAAEMRARKAAKKSLFIRRTLIPILLTCGLLLIAAACVKFYIGPDSTLRASIPVWLTPTFIAVALALFALAIVNMISVTKQAPLLKK